jgi:protein O-mannosyl-transferase
MFVALFCDCQEALNAAKSKGMRVERWLYLFLTLITVVAYSPVIGNDFINYDDPIYITANPHVQAGLTTRGVAWAFKSGYGANWHPLTWIAHMVDYQLYGLKPLGHHLTNLFFHGLNALLLFGVLKQLTRNLWPSAFVAALFALHPAHVESVAWASERKDVLSTFFWFLTMGAYVRYVRRPTPGLYLLALSFFALGLMSKPMVVTLPFVFLLLDYWPLNRIPAFTTDYPGQSTEHPVTAVSWKRLIGEKVPFFLLTMFSCIITFLAQSAGGAVASVQAISLPHRLDNVLISYSRYLYKAFWPSDLTLIYPYPESWSAWQVTEASLLLLALTILVMLQIRRRPYLLVGWLWFLGTLVPVIGIVQVGVQSLADRYTYIPLTGVFIMAVWFLADLLGRLPRFRPFFWTASAVVLMLCSILTWFQVRLWRDSVTLFKHTLAVTTNNGEAHALLGAALYNLGRYDEAQTHFKTALTIEPHSPDALLNVGLVLVRQGKNQEAIEHYLNILPENPNLSKVHLQMGHLLIHAGRMNEALEHYTETLRIDPENVSAKKGCGMTLARQGKVDEALVYFNEASRLEPLDPDVHYDLGLAYVMKGKRNLAIPEYREALRLQPNWPVALNDLAWILATHPDPQFRNGKEAVQLAERACTLNGNKELRYLGTLDAAYAEVGRFADAIKTTEKVKTMASVSGAKDLAEAAEKRLKFYRAGQPYHE